MNFLLPARLAVLAGLLLACAEAVAIPVTSLPNPVAIDMPVLARPQTRGPVSFADGLSWSSTSLASSFGDTRRQNLGENGDWTGAAGPFAALGAAEGRMTIAFGQPVRGVGAVLNHAPPAGVFTLAIHDADMKLLESRTLAFSSPCSPAPGCSPSTTKDAGEFHGFARESDEIHYFTMSDAYVVMRGLQVSVIPEPKRHVLLLAGLALLLISFRRRTH